MKKTIALILAAVMCFLLASCGGNAQNSDNNISDADSTVNGVVEDNESDGDGQADDSDTDNQADNNPLLQFLYGGWEYTGEQADEAAFTTLYVNTDGTCIVDDADGTWTVTESYEEFMYFDVLIDGQVICTAELDIMNGYNLWIHDDVADNPNDWKRTTEVTTDDNDIVLTTENWRDYFDLVIESVFRENDFGEVETIRIYQYLKLKSEYTEKAFLTDVVYEVESTLSTYKCNFNVEEKNSSFEITDEATIVSEPIIESLYEDWKIYFVNHIFDADETDVNVTLAADIEDVNMLRIQGNIYLINE